MKRILSAPAFAGVTAHMMREAARIINHEGEHMDQKPSVGRIVHYVSYGTPGGEFTSQCRAAIVTEVQEGVPFIGLVALNPTGMFFHSMDSGGCRHDEGEKRGGTWHWPEREEEAPPVAVQHHPI